MNFRSLVRLRKLSDDNNLKELTIGTSRVWFRYRYHRFPVLPVIFLCFAIILFYSLVWPAFKNNVDRNLRNVEIDHKGNKRLFYNRVPKCGSSTMVKLLEKLAERNGFTHKSSELLDEWGLFRSNDQVNSFLNKEVCKFRKYLQKGFVEAFNRQPYQFSYDRHLFFLDFTK